MIGHALIDDCAKGTIIPSSPQELEGWVRSTLKFQFVIIGNKLYCLQTISSLKRYIEQNIKYPWNRICSIRRILSWLGCMAIGQNPGQLGHRTFRTRTFRPLIGGVLNVLVEHITDNTQKEDIYDPNDLCQIFNFFNQFSFFKRPKGVLNVLFCTKICLCKGRHLGPRCNVS